MNFITDLLRIIGDAIAGLINNIFSFSPLIADLVVMGLASLILCTFAALSFMALTYAERKVVARIQDRVGPNQAGPLGLLQPLADGIKMFTKEDTTPTAADRWVYNLAPLVIAVFALTTYAVLPFSPGVVGTNLNVGLFYVLAIGSGSIVAIIMAGWGSNNKYALLGAFRTVAQLVGYEVPMLLNVLPVVMITGSLSLIDIIDHQTLVNGNPGLPHILFFPMAAVVFLISGIAETARSPFDLLEAESEIVAGFHVEYSGMKFALFFLGEYVNALAVAFMFCTLFLGGYAGPILPPYVWLLLKAAVVFSIFMWLRGTLPRVRIDQMHDMNWKFFVPASIVHLIIVMVLMKAFPDNPAQAEATGGILVETGVRAAILFASSALTFIVALAIVARRARINRLAEEALLEQRKLENMATAGA
jgi:NADH-quinone oxidoreductase subunit H